MIDTSLAIAGLIVGIIALIPLYYQWRKTREITWHQIDKSTDKLFQQIRSNGERFDVLACTPNGGLIMADLIWSNHDRNCNILCINVEQKKIDLGDRVTVIDQSWSVPGNMKGKRVIILDDIIKTGGNVRSVIRYLVEDLGVRKSMIKVACLGKSKSTPAALVDYYAFEFEVPPRLPWKS